KHYKSIDNLANATLMDLVTVDEIGIRIAESVVEFLGSDTNIKIIERLKMYGVHMEISVEKLANQTNKLKDQAFVVSGVFESLSRDELKKLIEDNGGKVLSGISTKTTYVIAGDNMGPSKKDKAEKLNIPIIDEY